MDSVLGLNDVMDVIPRKPELFFTNRRSYLNKETNKHIQLKTKGHSMSYKNTLWYSKI